MWYTDGTITNSLWKSLSLRRARRPAEGSGPDTLGSPSGRAETVKKALQSLPPAGGKSNVIRFLRRRVRRKKHFSVCKCGICSLSANKLCAQQTASLLPQKGFALLGQAETPPGGGISFFDYMVTPWSQARSQMAAAAFWGNCSSRRRSMAVGSMAPEITPDSRGVSSSSFSTARA